MRGGVNAHDLMYNTDIDDVSVLNRVIEENIESAKKSGMPLI